MESLTPKRDKRKVAKFVLAGIAILGIGAAATSAAWTDNVFFSADAEAATFDLQGSLVSGGPYEDLGIDDAENATIEIAASEFGSIIPGFDNTVTVYLYNAGSTDISLATPTETVTGDIFDGADAATVTVGTPATTTLAPGAETSLDIQVTTSTEWPSEYMGTTGVITVEVTGTAS